MTYENVYIQCHVLICCAAVAAAEIMDAGGDLMQEDLEQLKKAFNSSGVEECRSLLERKRDEWKSITLDVAVIGNSGVGKSSFINAIRGLTADDERAAAVGVTETTMEIRSYEHPRNPLLNFWDLPGVGSDRFPKETYLSKIGVDRFDFFLLISDDRFTQNDIWLGNELQLRNKKYFFMRTKIGVDVTGNKKRHPKSHNEKAVMKDIRKSIQQHLKDNGCENVPVFLIDNYKLKKFDFEQLKLRLVEDFPIMKKSALVLSLQATSDEMISLKVSELRSRIWKVAALSSVGAMVPLSGVSMPFDVALVAQEVDVYYTQLGLDETSLKRYSKIMCSDYRQLQSVVDSRLGCKLSGVDAVTKLVEMLSKNAVPLTTSAAMEEVSRFIPTIGSVIAASLSVGGTYYALKLVLDNMESVALEIVSKVESK